MLRQFMPHILLAATAAAAGLSSVARSALADDLKVSGPFVHDNLALYFLHGRSADGPVPLTLEEGLEKNRVKVSETGTVGELLIENTGDEEVMVHAGDIVKGGRQDRVVTTTFILKAKSGPTPLQVFCVEAGRWSARGSEDAKEFASAKEMMPSRKAKLSLRERSVAAARPLESAAAPAPEPPAFQPPGLARQQYEAANERQASGSSGGSNGQSEVWNEVSVLQSMLSAKVGGSVAAAESETSLQLALENEKLAKARQAYIDALEPRAAAEGGDVIGYVFAVNGKLNSADVYGSNAIFRKFWPKLLKASVTEALGAQDALQKADAPKVADVDAFLARAAAGKEDKLEPVSGVLLKARETEASFDSVTERPNGILLHRSVLAR